jgi:tripartite-type tricarboxylate transporter receptor subunit TctC
MIEAGVPEIGFFGWMGVYMPAGVAPEITNKLAGWLKEISNADDTKAFFRRIGADSFYLMPDEFTKFEEENFKEWEARADRRHPTAVALILLLVIFTQNLSTRHGRACPGHLA